MDRMKTFAIYALIIIVFFVFSNFLIAVGLNSSYGNISSKGEIPEQVHIDTAQATLINGRIYGTITNSGSDDISGKYLEIDFYSERDNLLGRTYIQINNLNKGETQDIELHFKLQNVDYYTLSITDEKIETGTEKVELIKDDMTRVAVWVGVALALINIPNLLAL